MQCILVKSDEYILFLNPDYVSARSPRSLRSNKHDKTQHGKVLKDLYIGFGATLNNWNFKVALNPMWGIFFDFDKSCPLSRLKLKLDNVLKKSPCYFWFISL